LPLMQAAHDNQYGNVTFDVVASPTSAPK